MQQRIKHRNGEIEVTMPPGHPSLTLSMERTSGRGLTVILRGALGDYLFVDLARNDREEEALMKRLDKRCIELYDRAAMQPISGAVSIEQ